MCVTAGNSLHFGRIDGSPRWAVETGRYHHSQSFSGHRFGTKP